MRALLRVLLSLPVVLLLAVLIGLRMHRQGGRL